MHRSGKRRGGEFGRAHGLGEALGLQEAFGAHNKSPTLLDVHLDLVGGGKGLERLFDLCRASVASHPLHGEGINRNGDPIGLEASLRDGLDQGGGLGAHSGNDRSKSALEANFDILCARGLEGLCHLGDAGFAGHPLDGDGEDHGLFFDFGRGQLGGSSFDLGSCLAHGLSLLGALVGTIRRAASRATIHAIGLGLGILGGYRVDEEGACKGGGQNKTGDDAHSCSLHSISKRKNKIRHCERISIQEKGVMGVILVNPAIGGGARPFAVRPFCNVWREPLWGGRDSPRESLP